MTTPFNMPSCQNEFSRQGKREALGLGFKFDREDNKISTTTWTNSESFVCLDSLSLFFLKMKTTRTCKASTVRTTSTRCVHHGKKLASAFRFRFNVQPRRMRHFVGSQYVADALKARVLTECRYIFKII